MSILNKGFDRICLKSSYYGVYVRMCMYFKSISHIQKCELAKLVYMYIHTYL